MTDGIYTLANDVVHNQLVALLNSIEVNAGKEIPVCIIPYDDRLDKVRAEIKTRKNVTLLEDAAILARWEEFSLRIWQTHPQALSVWQNEGITGIYRPGMHRRFCAFDPESPFERFIYLDADTLVMDSLSGIFQQLDRHDFVVYDFQYKDPSHVYNVQSPKLIEVFSEERIKSEIFCAGFYAAKRGIFTPEKREELIAKLAEGDAEILYMPAPDQSVLNYMTMKSGIPAYNLALHLPKSETTGCSVTSPHFETRDRILYDKGNRLTYLHYIGVSTKLFNRLCDGENLECPYREVFLHYRYLREPEKRPQFKTKPKPYTKYPGLATRVLRKLGLAR